MNWLNLLSKIGHAVNVGLNAASIVSAEAPGLVSVIPGGSIGVTIINGIIKAEQAFPGPGLGAIKNQLVTADTVNQHPGADPAAVANDVTQIVETVKALHQAVNP